MGGGGGGGGGLAGPVSVGGGVASATTFGAGTIGFTGGGGGAESSKILRVPASIASFCSFSRRSSLILGSIRLISVPSLSLIVIRKSSTDRATSPPAAV